MANVATNLIRELFTREPTDANKCVDETKSDLETAVEKNRCAVVRFKQAVQAHLTGDDPVADTSEP